MIAPLVTPTQPHTVALSAISRDVEPGVGRRRRKQQVPALRRQVGAGAQPFHVAMAVGGVADEDHAGELAVAHRQLLVDAERAIFVAHRLGVAGSLQSPAEKTSTPMIFSFAACTVPVVRRALVAGDRRRQHLALLEQRRDQPVADAAMLDALADGEDVRVRRLHVVVDDDAAVDVQRRPCGRARRSAGCRRRPRPGRRRCRSPSANATPSTRSSPRIAVVLSAEQHADAQVFHLRLQVAAAVGIELPLHQRRHQVHDGDVAALHLQPARGFEPEQPAADDHRLHAWLRALQQFGVQAAN